MNEPVLLGCFTFGCFFSLTCVLFSTKQFVSLWALLRKLSQVRRIWTWTSVWKNRFFLASVTFFYKQFARSGRDEDVFGEIKVTLLLLAYIPLFLSMTSNETLRSIFSIAAKLGFILWAFGLKKPLLLICADVEKGGLSDHLFLYKDRVEQRWKWNKEFGEAERCWGERN